MSTELLGLPSGDVQIGQYQGRALALQQAEDLAALDRKVYGIGAAIAFSLGTSIALSAQSSKARAAGAAIAGAGVVSGGVAFVAHRRLGAASVEKNKTIRALNAAGASAPSGVVLTAGAKP